MPLNSAETIAAKLIYVTASSEEEATKIATTLVEKKLVACANILGPSTSIYWWEDSINLDREVVFILKTKAELVERVIAQIKDLHSYDIPAIAVLDIEKSPTDFLNWIDKNTL